ncbi:MAG: universal stress protein [Cyclobacteriaceae bacterium]|nr:universal stress protein [Cyclobacteriaceae bacterium]
MNSHLVLDFATEFIQDSESLLLKVVLVSFIVFFAFLILLITAYPLFRKRDQSKDADFHGALIELDLSQDLPVNRIAIAVDFSVADAKLIKTAIQHAHQATEFIFIHVVESATAKYLADASDDEETRKDQMRLDIYAQALEKKGYKAKACLGYHHRVKEIVRLVSASNAQLLVMGAHQHQGWKDYVFGETIDPRYYFIKVFSSQRVEDGCARIKKILAIQGFSPAVCVGSNDDFNRVFHITAHNGHFFQGVRILLE